MDKLRLPLGGMNRVKKAIYKFAPKIEIIEIVKVPCAGNIAICQVKIDGKEHEISYMGINIIKSAAANEIIDDPQECIKIAEAVNKVDPRLGEAAEKEKWTWWRPTQTLNSFISITNLNVINSGL